MDRDGGKERWSNEEMALSGIANQSELAPLMNVTVGNKNSEG